MQKGWNSAGLLELVWARVGGRDQLARLADIKGPVLSRYNTAGGLGPTNAKRIMDAMRKAGKPISPVELGGPAGETDRRGQNILARLEALEDRDVTNRQADIALGQQIVALEARLEALETQRRAAPAGPKRPRARRSAS